MEYSKTKDTDTIQKTLRIPKPIVEEIEAMARDSERDFSKQVNFMLKEYIRIKKG